MIFSEIHSMIIIRPLSNDYLGEQKISWNFWFVCCWLIFFRLIMLQDWLIFCWSTFWLKNTFNTVFHTSNQFLMYSGDISFHFSTMAFLNWLIFFLMILVFGHQDIVIIKKFSRNQGYQIRLFSFDLGPQLIS